MIQRSMDSYPLPATSTDMRLELKKFCAGFHGPEPGDFRFSEPPSSADLSGYRSRRVTPSHPAGQIAANSSAKRSVRAAIFISSQILSPFSKGATTSSLVIERLA